MSFSMTHTILFWLKVAEEKSYGWKWLGRTRKTGQLPVAVKSSETPVCGGSRRFHRQLLSQSDFLWLKS
jgi:hypothetical protein